MPFPARLSIWSPREGPELAAQRRPQLEEWLNKILFLNNTLVASGHFELNSLVVSPIRTPALLVLARPSLRDCLRLQQEFCTPQTLVERRSVPDTAAAEPVGPDEWRAAASAAGFVSSQAVDL